MENQYGAFDAPTAVNVTVEMKRPREYLKEVEIERLMEAAHQNRWGHRDATAILLAYRHGVARQRACWAPVGRFRPAYGPWAGRSAWDKRRPRSLICLPVIDLIFALFAFRYVFDLTYFIPL